MRDPLHEYSSRRRKLSYLLAHTAQITRTKSSELTMNRYSCLLPPDFYILFFPLRSWLFALGALLFARRPYMNVITRFSKAFGHKLCVIAHATYLRRILQREDLPLIQFLFFHCEQPLLSESFKPDHAVLGERVELTSKSYRTEL